MSEYRRDQKPCLLGYISIFSPLRLREKRKLDDRKAVQLRGITLIVVAAEAFAQDSEPAADRSCQPVLLDGNRAAPAGSPVHKVVRAAPALPVTTAGSKAVGADNRAVGAGSKAAAVAAT